MRLICGKTTIVLSISLVGVRLRGCYGGPLFCNNLHEINVVQGVSLESFTLCVNKERQSSVQAMQLSNGVSNAAGMWFGHLLFDDIPGLIIVTVASTVFAAMQSDQFRFRPLLV